jgi:hypothetical protein
VVWNTRAGFTAASVSAVHNIPLGPLQYPADLSVPSLDLLEGNIARGSRAKVEVFQSEHGQWRSTAGQAE